MALSMMVVMTNEVGCHRRRITYQGDQLPCLTRLRKARSVVPWKAVTDLFRPPPFDWKEKALESWVDHSLINDAVLSYVACGLAVWCDVPP